MNKKIARAREVCFFRVLDTPNYWEANLSALMPFCSFSLKSMR